MKLPSDLIDLLAEFENQNVRYLLVGGQAVALHGHPRFTKDADLWIEDEPHNIMRCREALRAFGAPDEAVDNIASATGLDVVWMGHPPARIDLVKTVPGGDFKLAWHEHVTMDVDSVPVQVVSRATLIALKRASGRPQDLADVALLEQTE